MEREIDGTKYRLLGIGVTDLSDSEHADPPDLSDGGAVKRAAVEAAMDRLRDKFGNKSIETGYTFGRGRRGRVPTDETG
jgi:DNA polymerase-4